MTHTDTVHALTYLLFVACAFDALILDHGHDPEPHFPEWDMWVAEHERIVQCLSESEYRAFVDMLDAR